MKKTKSIFFMFTIIALIATALVLAGCSTAIKQGQGTTVDAANTATQSPTADQTPTTPTNDVPVKTETTVEIAVNSTKPAEVQQQETALQVIADGTYTEQTHYQSPGGQDTIEVSLSVEKDVVTAVSVKAISADKTSTRFINGVNAALPDLVVGKKISELNLPKQISGSSLTTAAFKAEVATLIDKY